MATTERDALRAALDALEEIALAGMSGSGQESEGGMRDWHARRAWEFIGIAARALGPARAALAAPPVEQQAARLQYYYKVNGCPAPLSKSPGCICWHDKGTGPRANDPGHGLTWRATPPAPTEQPSIEDLCARIKAADDAAADNDYMLDSNDCISVLRGTWTGPLAMDKPERPAPQAGAVEMGKRCQQCIDRQDGFYGSYAPPCPRHDDDGKPRATYATEQPSQDAARGLKPPHWGAIHTEPSGKVELWPAAFREYLDRAFLRGAAAAQAQGGAA